MRTCASSICVLSFLFYVCDPSASLPDGETILLLFSDYVCSSNFILITTISALIHFLLKIGGTFLSNVIFVPFNIRLNMLSKRTRNKYKLMSYIQIYFLIHIFISVSDEKVSILASSSNWVFLDTMLFVFLTRVIWTHLLYTRVIIHIGLHLINFIYIYLLHLDNFPFEFSGYWIFNLLLLLSSDIHPNPGPLNDNNDFLNGFFSFCNWNLNTLSKDNFNRISILEAHNSIFKYDIISLCETSLNDDLPVPDNALPKYYPYNHPSGERKGGVGIFYKDDLPIRIRNDLSFDECLVTELIFGRKNIFFTVFYRNPENNANSPEFLQFLTKFENLHTEIQNLNPYATFYTGDVNGHSQSWFADGNTNAEGLKLDECFSNLNLYQLINEPTHFFRDDFVPRVLM